MGATERLVGHPSSGHLGRAALLSQQEGKRTDLKALDLMTSEVSVAAPDDDLDVAMALMDRRDLRHLPIVDSEGVVGILSDRDLLAETGWLAPRQRELLEAPQRRVRDVMHSSPQVAAPDDPVSALASRLALARIGCLPIVEGSELRGIVTETDVLAACRDALGAGAASEERDLPVAKIMVAEVATVTPDSSAESAASLLRERGIRHLPVVEAGNVVGMVSDRDVRQAIGRGGIELSNVESLMTAGVVSLDLEARMSKAAALLAELPISCLPVTEGGELKGVVTVTDLLTAYAQQLTPA